MCTVLLPPCVNPIAVDKYIVSYHMSQYGKKLNCVNSKLSVIWIQWCWDCLISLLNSPLTMLLASLYVLLLVVMLDRHVPTYSARLLATHSIRLFPLHFPSSAQPCAIRFQLSATTVAFASVWRTGREADSSPTYIARLRISGAVPPVPLYAVMECIGRTVTFTCIWGQRTSTVRIISEW